MQIKRSKKAQSAVESLMTYGWVIILVAAVIIVLFFLGVFSPLHFVSPSPTISGFTGVKVTTVVSNSTYIEFYITNSLSVPVSLNKFSMVYNNTKFSDVTCQYLTLSPGQNSICFAKLKLANTRDTVSLGISFAVSSNINASSNGTISFTPSSAKLSLPPVITEFTEGGLPTNFQWWVDYNGVNHSSSGVTVSFASSPGNYSFSTGNFFANGCSFTALPSSGYVEAGLVENIIFVNSCAATFIEKELPLGTKWQVKYAGVDNSSTSNLIVFTNEKSGTYSFSVSNVVVGQCNYSASPSSGSLAVGQYQYIRFLGECTTTFTESGLPSSYTWQVTFDGITKTNSSPSSITYFGPPGKFSYSVKTLSNTSSTVNCSTTYTPTPSANSLQAGQSVSIAFSTLTSCKNIFEETGWSAGYTWQVAYDNVVNSSSTPNNVIVYTSQSNSGIYTYTATASIDGLYCTSSTSSEQGTTFDFSTWSCVTAFTESNLPSSDSWSVVFAGQTNSSTRSTLSFITSPGTFSWSASAPDTYPSTGCTTSYLATPSSGTDIAGNESNIGVSFSSSTVCTTTFTESGLLSGYTWSISYDSQSISNSTGSPITFNTGPGTFTASASVDGLTCTASASVTAGSSYTFSSWSCPTTFTESGLPSGDSWSVTFAGQTKSSTGSTITFQTGAGSDSWSASASDTSPSTGCTTSYNSQSGSANYGSSVGVSFPSSTSCTTTFYPGNIPSSYTWYVYYDGEQGSQAGNTAIRLTTGPGYMYATSSIGGLDCSTGGQYVTAGTSATFSSWNCNTNFYVWTGSPEPSSESSWVTFEGDQLTKSWESSDRVTLPNGATGLDFLFTFQGSSNSQSWSIENPIDGVFGDCGFLTGYDQWSVNSGYPTSGNIYPGQDVYVYYNSPTCPV